MSADDPVSSPVLRRISRVVAGMAATDGAGVRLRRVIGTPALADIDPFLMLDEFGSDDPDAYIAGFPDHPHRGFETITYMLAGRMRHRDNKGHEGVLNPGDAQWMTAGSGLIHSEMPEQDHGLLLGFQFWLNLPAADKMQPPHYQDISANLIPVIDHDGLRLTLVAGELDGHRGPVASPVTQPLIAVLDFSVSTAIHIPVADGHAGFAYAQTGDVQVGGTVIPQGHLGVLAGDGPVSVSAHQGARLLLATARPLGEAVARHGPFVMNTRQELIQAFADYDAGLF